MKVKMQRKGRLLFLYATNSTIFDLLKNWHFFVEAPFPSRISIMVLKDSARKMMNTQTAQHMTSMHAEDVALSRSRPSGYGWSTLTVNTAGDGIDCILFFRQHSSLFVWSLVRTPLSIVAVVAWTKTGRDRMSRIRRDPPFPALRPRRGSKKVVRRHARQPVAVISSFYIAPHLKRCERFPRALHLFSRSPGA